jgi:iron complex transport system permease protein
VIRSQQIAKLNRLVIWAIALLVTAVLSLKFGAADTAWQTIWQMVVAYDPTDKAQLIVFAMRVPRIVAALLVGAALAVSGALMQGLTRNPLADPGLIGIEAGAALAVVSGATLLGWRDSASHAVLAAIGAFVTMVCVLSLGSLGGSTRPMVLIIAGTAVTVLLSAVTSTILIFEQQTMSEVRFWLAGGVAGRSWAIVTPVVPFLLVGFVLAILVARHVTILSFGEEVARGLGQQTQRIQLLTLLAVVMLTGSAVALAGPIGFVGLVVPHVVRPWIGSDYRWLVPFTMLIGGVVLIVADIVARILLAPLELSVGVMMALCGGPFFVMIVRRWSKR